MKRFKDFLEEQKAPQPLTPYPKEKIRTQMTDAEKPWEWREYHKFAKDEFPHAFKDEKHFWSEYDKAPLQHLPDHAWHNMGYSTVSKSTFHAGKEAFHKEPYFQGRRDPKKISQGIEKGGLPPIIVLKHSKGHRILGGNTRAWGMIAHGYNPPVKLIDISDRH